VGSRACHVLTPFKASFPHARAATQPSSGRFSPPSNQLPHRAETTLAHPRHVPSGSSSSGYRAAPRRAASRSSKRAEHAPPSRTWLMSRTPDVMLSGRTLLPRLREGCGRRAVTNVLFAGVFHRAASMSAARLLPKQPGDEPIETTQPVCLQRKRRNGSDGTRTRDLRRDRPAF
jgi:hypothetical protein